MFDAGGQILEGAVAAKGRTELVWVDGTDAVGFLQGLLTQNVAAMQPGESASSLLLAPNGKLRATLTVLRAESRVGLACDAGRAEIVAGDLERFRIRVDATISIEDRSIWDVWGTAARDELPRSVPDGLWWEDDASVVFAMPFRHSSVARLVVVGAKPALTEVPADALEAFRIRIGEPVMGVDLDERTIPQEGLAVDTAVDFDKGCYLGQELVARIDSRGHVNRRLMGVRFAANAAVAPGAEVLQSGKTVGAVTSVAAVGDAVIAIGMLRIAVDVGAGVTAGVDEGVVVGFPMTG